MRTFWGGLMIPGSGGVVMMTQQKKGHTHHHHRHMMPCVYGVCVVTQYNKSTYITFTSTSTGLRSVCIICDVYT
jgi:hypothetical protein